MSVSGSPETATRSANLPFSIAPTRSSHPMFSAPRQDCWSIVHFSRVNAFMFRAVFGVSPVSVYFLTAFGRSTFQMFASTCWAP